MPENNLITKSIRRECSLARYSVRALKDACLHDDVEYLMARRQESVSRLVDRLLNNEFVLARHTDPTYPA